MDSQVLKIVFLRFDFLSSMMAKKSKIVTDIIALQNEYLLSIEKALRTMLFRKYLLSFGFLLCVTRMQISTVTFRVS